MIQDCLSDARADGGRQHPTESFDALLEKFQLADFKCHPRDGILQLLSFVSSVSPVQLIQSDYSGKVHNFSREILSSGWSNSL